jgi:RNA polymerase sigma factor (sigma-70 family)
MNAIHASRARTASTSASHITRLLHAAGVGDRVAWGKLVDLAYPELERLAHACHPRSHAVPRSDDHPLALAVRIMRQMLVEHARERLALKHGSDATAVAIDAIDPADERQFEQLAEIDDALRCLAAHQPRQAQVFECRYFGGLDDDETALALAVSARTVRREREAARAWLAQELMSVRRVH